MEANPNPSAIENGGGYDNSHTSALTVLNSIGYALDTPSSGHLLITLIIIIIITI